MSDISLTFTWWELILFSPILGWPGLLIGGFAGAMLWRRRPIVGGALGALVGNLVWAYASVMLP
jgi:hypothetical protein